ncbi:MAG TPA: hypothetical protein ENJ20_07415, partial [Bacteroidetes bacterium]|nr:hypothetical protein [Bacteroidota bacterium]
PPRRNPNTLYAATQFMPGSTANGISAGYLREIYSAKSNHWTLEAGVGYAYINQPLHYTVSVSDSSVTDPSTEIYIEEIANIAFSNESLIADLSTNNSLFLKNTTFNRLRLHYLTFPVQINYWKGRFWGNLGAETSLLLAAKNNQLQGGIFRMTDQLEAISPSGQYQATRPGLANVDFSATFGAGILLSPCVGIHLQYKLGLNDIIHTNSQKDHNRFFRLAMQYRIRN